MSLTVEPTEATIKHLAHLDASESDGEESEGTAKQKKAEGTARPHEGSDSSSQSRLSNLYGWLSTPISPSPTRASVIFAPERVSEPKLVQHLTGGSHTGSRDVDPSADSSVDQVEFEQMLVCLDDNKAEGSTKSIT